MRIIAVLFLILGVALAGGAVFFAQEHFRLREAMMSSRDSGKETVRLIAASKRLSYGDKLDSKTAYFSLTWVDWPKNSVPKGAFTSEAELLGPNGKQTRSVLRTIEPGELILMSKLTGFGGAARVATQVSEGMRAFTIPINAISGVAGFVGPGDRVDILLTRTVDSGPITSVILQNVLVIGTDQRVNQDTNRAAVAATATIEVTPNEAQKLTLAQTVGRLSLTLRNANETEEKEMTPVSMQDLPDTPEAVQQEQKEEQLKVRVRRGGGNVEAVKVD